MDIKKTTTVLIVIIVTVAVSAIVAANIDSERNQPGLYALDAQVIDVDRGGITTTPKMVSAIEELYEQVYGDLVKTGFTIEDAKNDVAFWNTYCNYDSTVEAHSDGSFTVTITLMKGDKKIHLDSAADTMLSMGTMYPTTLYYFLCQKHSVEPYSDQALNNSDLKKEFQSMAAGAMSLKYIEGNTELIDYYDREKYKDCGRNGIADYDIEQMSQDTKELVADGRKVILVASGRTMGDSKYESMRNIFQTNGGMDLVFVTATTIKEAFSNIECMGYVLGFEKSTTMRLIEDLQVRLYAVYYSLQEKSEEHKVYWETHGGKSISAESMSDEIIKFMGWDTSLITGAEVDTETLLMEKPDILIFYSNDHRPTETKMRV